MLSYLIARTDPVMWCSLLVLLLAGYKSQRNFNLALLGRLLKGIRASPMVATLALPLDMTPDYPMYGKGEGALDLELWEK